MIWRKRLRLSDAHSKWRACNCSQASLIKGWAPFHLGPLSYGLRKTNKKKNTRDWEVDWTQEECSLSWFIVTNARRAFPVPWISEMLLTVRKRSSTVYQQEKIKPQSFGDTFQETVPRKRTIVIQVIPRNIKLLINKYFPLWLSRGSLDIFDWSEFSKQRIILIFNTRMSSKVTESDITEITRIVKTNC